MSLDFTAYGTNILGLLTVAAVAGVGWCVRNKFKHSDCELNSGCLKVSSHEDSETRNTIRREILEQLRLEGIIPDVMIVDPPATSDVKIVVEGTRL